MSTVLALSPHLDDVAFSCGGTLALLGDAGWRTVMATVFTRSVVPATGFALACQLDKGLPADVDYMALRRAEDVEAGRVLRTEVRWLDLPEAPHRGYDSAPALFAGAHATDTVWQDLATLLAELVEEYRPNLVLCPQGLGRHVDHLQTIRAVLTLSGIQIAFYRDTPYAIRDPAAEPDGLVPVLTRTRVDIGAALARKVEAAGAYATQVGFQFGGRQAAGRALEQFAGAEGGERFMGEIPALGTPEA